MVVRDRGIRRVLALVTGLKSDALVWAAEASSVRPAPTMRLSAAAQMIGG